MCPASDLVGIAEPVRLSVVGAKPFATTESSSVLCSVQEDAITGW